MCRSQATKRSNSSWSCVVPTYVEHDLQPVLTHRLHQFCSGGRGRVILLMVCVPLVVDRSKLYVIVREIFEASSGGRDE